MNSLEQEEKVRYLLNLLDEERQKGLSTESAQTEDDDIPPIDLKTLFGELLALKSEIRAETEATRKFREQMISSLDHLWRVVEQKQQQEEKRNNITDQYYENFRKKAILNLIDLSDRIESAHETSKKIYNRKWFLSFLVNKTMAYALAQGLELLKKKILVYLDDWNVQQIQVIGQQYNPFTMEVIETQSDPHVQDGLVVEEITRGYQEKGTTHTIFRIAQVVVNKNKRENENDKR